MINQSIWRQWVWRMPHVKKNIWASPKQWLLCVPIWARLRMEDAAGKKPTGSFNDFLGDTYDSSMDLRVPNFQSMIWAGWWGKSWRNGPYLSQALLQARCTSPKRVSELQSNLVGGFNPSKNMKVSWDDYSKYTENHQPEVFWTFAGKSATVCNLTWLAIKALPFIPIYRLTR